MANLLKSVGNIRQVDQAGLSFIALQEGCRLAPYLDARGKATIGIGCTFYEGGNPVTMRDPPITEQRALQLFGNVLKVYEHAVWSFARRDITQNMFNALVDICYNIGPDGFKKSLFLRLVNKNPKSFLLIKAAFLLWSFSGGKKILFTRRLRDGALYSS